MRPRTGPRKGARNGLRVVLCLALGGLAAACTVYKVRDVDAKALAAKLPKGKILRARTASGVVDFREDEPAQFRDNAVVGGLHGSLTFSPGEIAEVGPANKRVQIVLKNGDRFQVVGSRRAGDILVCSAIWPQWIPLDEVLSVRVKSVNTGASILRTLGGVVLLAGALLADAALYGDDVEAAEDSFSGGVISSYFDALTERGPGPDPPLARSLAELSVLRGDMDTAGQEEFWNLEWSRVDAAAVEGGRCQVRLGSAPGVLRNIDEAKLAVVDHEPGVQVAPDILGNLRACANPVPPVSATMAGGVDINALVRDKDGLFWRSPGGDLLATDARTSLRDTLTFEFPRPKGVREAKLIVSLTNSTWPALFAREARAIADLDGPDSKKKPAYAEWEYSKLRVRLLTAFGWQTAQVLYAGGPLPAEDLVYTIRIDDVATDKIWLKLAPPAGYWLIDRVALDFGVEAPLEGTFLEPEAADGPDAADVLHALGVEDGTVLSLEKPGEEAVLTFELPPLKEGLVRTLFLRTVSCYDMPPRQK